MSIRSTLRTRSVLAALLPACLLAACGKEDAENATANVEAAKPAADLYVVKAGTITGNRTPGINSWFRIQKSKDGIETDRKGGACIVFRASDLDYQVQNPVCNTDDDCGSGGNPGYCEIAAHVCWARPKVAANAKDPLCKRSVDQGAPPAWPAGTNINISDNPISVPAGLKPNAQARTIALLRLKGDVGPPVVVWGDPKPIP
jgi:hypothetical protein